MLWDAAILSFCCCPTSFLWPGKFQPHFEWTQTWEMNGFELDLQEEEQMCRDKQPSGFRGRTNRNRALRIVFSEGTCLNKRRWAADFFGDSCRTPLCFLSLIQCGSENRAVHIPLIQAQVRSDPVSESLLSCAAFRVFTGPNVCRNGIGWPYKRKIRSIWLKTKPVEKWINSSCGLSRAHWAVQVSFGSVWSRTQRLFGPIKCVKHL